MGSMLRNKSAQGSMGSKKKKRVLWDDWNDIWKLTLMQSRSGCATGIAIRLSEAGMLPCVWNTNREWPIKALGILWDFDWAYSTDCEKAIADCEKERLGGRRLNTRSDIAPQMLVLSKLCKHFEWNCYVKAFRWISSGTAGSVGADLHFFQYKHA